MTPEGLDDYVWRSLPAMKFVAGRRVVARLTRAAAKRLPSEVLGQCLSLEGRDRVLGQLVQTVQRHERANYQMGFVLSFLLSALVSEIVRALWQWWWESASNRTLLVGWQAEDRL